MGGGIFLAGNKANIERRNFPIRSTFDIGCSMFPTSMNAESPPRPRRSARPIAFIVVALIIAVVVIAIFWRMETWPARTVRDLSAAFIDVAHLQPKITIKNRIYLEQTAETAELATVVRRTEVEHEFLHSWAGSTKRIQLRGTFLVKAGFDLHKNFSVEVRSDEI